MGFSSASFRLENLIPSRRRRRQRKSPPEQSFEINVIDVSSDKQHVHDDVITSSHPPPYKYPSKWSPRKLLMFLKILNSKKKQQRREAARNREGGSRPSYNSSGNYSNYTYSINEASLMSSTDYDVESIFAPLEESGHWIEGGTGSSAATNSSSTATNNDQNSTETEECKMEVSAVCSSCRSTSCNRLGTMKGNNEMKLSAHNEDSEEEEEDGSSDNTLTVSHTPMHHLADTSDGDDTTSQPKRRKSAISFAEDTIVSGSDQEDLESLEDLDSDLMGEYYLLQEFLIEQAEMARYQDDYLVASFRRRRSRKSRQDLHGNSDTC